MCVHKKTQNERDKNKIKKTGNCARCGGRNMKTVSENMMWIKKYP
jgi:hypothetical protein